TPYSSHFASTKTTTGNRLPRPFSFIAGCTAVRSSIGKTSVKSLAGFFIPPHPSNFAVRSKTKFPAAFVDMPRVRAVNWRNHIVHKTGRLPPELKGDQRIDGVWATLELAQTLRSRRDDLASTPEVNTLAGDISESFKVRVHEVKFLDNHRLRKRRGADVVATSAPFRSARGPRCRPPAGAENDTTWCNRARLAVAMRRATLGARASGSRLRERSNLRSASNKALPETAAG